MTINIEVKRQRQEINVSDYSDDDLSKQQVISEDQKISDSTLTIPPYKSFKSMASIDIFIGHGKKSVNKNLTKSCLRYQYTS